MDADVPKVMRPTEARGLFSKTSPEDTYRYWRFSGFSGYLLPRDDSDFTFSGRCTVIDWGDLHWLQAVHITYSRVMDVLEMDWGYLVKGRIERVSADDNVKLLYDYDRQIVMLDLLAQKPPFHLDGHLFILVT